MVDVARHRPILRQHRATAYTKLSERIFLEDCSIINRLLLNIIAFRSARVWWVEPSPTEILTLGWKEGGLWIPRRAQVR